MNHPMRSIRPAFFLHVLPCVMALFALGDPADGISWLTVPVKNKNVSQGSPFELLWHYKMENETFLSSKIYFLINDNGHYNSLASRHKGEDKYFEYERENSTSLVLGKNNVTLIVHNAKIGRNITYCCEVESKSMVTKTEYRRCSKVFVYAIPQITHHVPQLSCKQGDSIKLQCNATGFPKPHVDWIHDDTHERIDRSAYIVLNITGKRSEGIYCCDADNGFGRGRACTAVTVTDYEPDNTTLSVKQTNKDDINIFHITCKAVASPPSNHFIITFNGTQYNSSDGLEIIEVRAPKKDKRYETDISCIPYNKYGEGPAKNVLLPLYVPPRFITDICTEHNMTVSGITLDCNVAGFPPPNITWTTADNGDIVGTGKHFQVPFVKCATTRLGFYCHAKNAMGNITSPEIHVEVMTSHNCSTVDKGFDETKHMLSMKLVLIVSVVGGFVFAVIFVLTRLWWIKKIKEQKDSMIPIHEDPYQEPIDALRGRDGSQSLIKRSNTACSDEAYATVEECAPRPKQQVGTTLRKTRDCMEDIVNQGLETVVPNPVEMHEISINSNISSDEGNATAENCNRLRRDACCIPMMDFKEHPSPRDEDSQYESLVQYMPSEV